MRQSGVARVGKGSQQRQSESGSGATRSSAPSDPVGTLSLGQAHGNRALVSHVGRLAIQRKCAQCEEEDEEAVTIQRFARGSAASASASGADEQTTEPAPGPQPEQITSPDTTPTPDAPVPSAEGEGETAAAAPALIVDDETETVGPDQMTKTAFLDALRPEVCAAVDRGLAGTGQNSDGCPHVEYWFAHLAEKDAAFVERGIRRFASAREVRTAADYIPAVASRVQASTEEWALTGEVTGVPEELAAAVGGGEMAPGAGGAPAAPAIRFKARAGGARPPDSPAAVRDELGSGRPLDSGVRGRMESAYGTHFGHVRVHTDATGARLSDRLNARAFAVGEHVAFGAGEYHPNTPLGDALIAHELAHVVQQGGGAGAVAPMQVGSTSDVSLEAEADRGAMRAVSSLWGAARGVLGDVAQHAVPRLRSGLRLSACKRKEPCTTKTTAPTPRKTVTVRHSHLWGGGSTAEFTTLVTEADRLWDIAGIDVVAGNEETIGETDTKNANLLGPDAILDLSGDPPRSGSYTAEEKALLAHNSAGGEVTAYFVKTIGDGSYWGMSYVDSDKFAIEPGSPDYTIGHELGHLLIGLGHASNSENLMAKIPTGVKCLSDNQIDEARGDSLAK
jgi:hypothetical protein